MECRRVDKREECRAPSRASQSLPAGDRAPGARAGDWRQKFFEQQPSSRTRWFRAKDKSSRVNLLKCHAVSEPANREGFAVKRSLRCRCVVVLVVVSVVTGALASGSAMASELSWPSPQRIDATKSPRLYPSPVVSCASASFCVAVDQNS